MRLIGVGAALLAGLGACGGDPDAELAAAKARGDAMYVSAGSGQALVSVSNPDYRPTTEINAIVTIDDAQMDWQPPGTTMWHFKQTANMNDPGVSLAQIAGRSTTWEMTVEHLFTPRTIAQSTVTPNVFFLTPTTDLLSRPNVTLKAPDGTFETVDATYNAGTLTLTTTLPPGQYEFVEIPLEAHVLSCDGPVECHASPFTSGSLTFSVAP